MSDIGLYSSRYHQIRAYAELVDDVLLELNSKARLASSRYKELGSLLTKMSGQQYDDDLLAKSVALLIRADGSLSMSDLMRAGNNLLDEEVDSETLAILSKLAKFFNVELSRAMEGIDRRLR